MEIYPESQKRRKKLFESAPVSYEKRSEKLQEVKEKDEKEQEDSERVAEKIIDNLEQFGIKCPRCSNKNVKEDLSLPGAKNLTHLRCDDCDYRWREAKT